MAEELVHTADSLLGVFVDRARQRGRSWADIGQALGVSKQAAHERFVGPDLTRFTARARAAVVLASEEAGRLGYRWVSPEHIVLGLMREGDGVAARTLEALGLSIDSLRARVADCVPGNAEAAPGGVAPPLNPQAMRLLGEAATSAATALGHKYVGTEHLLLAVCTQRDASVDRILEPFGVGCEAVKVKTFEVLKA